MNNPLISVIIPTYKRLPEIINRSLESVINQTYSNIEIIVIDDSPDTFEHRETVKHYVKNLYDKRVKYIQHGENKGACAARNTGIRNAQGSYIAFLDDDDEWMVNKLEAQIKQFSNKQIGLVYCRAKVVDEIKSEIRSANHVVLRKGFLFDNLMRNNFVGSTSFVLIKKEVFETVGYFEETLQSNQDWELFLRIAKHFQFSYVDDYLVKYYIHKGERITSNYKKKLQGIIYLYDLYAEYLTNHKNIKSYWLIKMAPLYFKNGQKHMAAKAIILAFKSSPNDFFKNSTKFIRNRLRKT